MKNIKQGKHEFGECIWTPAQVAKILKVSVRTLGKWRHLRRGPKYLRLGRVVRYHSSDVEEWLSANTVEHEE